MPATSRRATLVLRPQVRLDDALVAAHLLRGSFGDLLAWVEHDDAAGHSHNHFHVVLDQENGDPLVDDLVHEAHELDLLLRREAGGGLVQEQKRGICGERPRDLKPALRAIRQVARVDMGVLLDADELEELHRAVCDALLLAVLGRCLEERVPQLRVHSTVLPETHVVEGRHVLEEPDVLERPRDAERRDLVRLRAGDLAALEDDPSGGGREYSGDPVEERGLTRAVRSDQRENLALLDVKRDVVDSHESPEALRDVVDPQDRVGSGLDGHVVSAFTSSIVVSSCTPFWSSSARCRLGRRPCGRSSMVSTRIRPKMRYFSLCTSPARPGQSPLGLLRLVAPIELAKSEACCGSPGRMLKIT